MMPMPARIARQWLPAIAGLGAMYVPTLLFLFQNTWSFSDQSHGPVVLALVVWLFWRSYEDIEKSIASASDRVLGITLVFVAAIAYVIGRSMQIQLLEVGSAIPSVAGVLSTLRGHRAMRAAWFALFFMLFLVPLPGAVVDAVTQPMKIAVSYVASSVLLLAGYPIARDGVVLHVGPYQMLVADACAGLQTLFTLEAIGLLYLNVVRHTSMLRNAGLAILIVPISFAANVLRVVTLCLITYHFGDAAGQGFLHGLAGLFLFLCALALTISADSALRFVSTVKRQPI